VKADPLYVVKNHIENILSHEYLKLNLFWIGKVSTLCAGEKKQ